jgi:hypothetical protein
MGYYMRFFDTSGAPLTVRDIECAMKQHDSHYRLEPPTPDDQAQADLYFGDGLYAEVEINQQGDKLFEGEIEEMLQFVRDNEGDNRGVVEQVLKSTKRVVAVRVLGQDRSSDETLDGIQTLWDWLFSTRTGLLQADGEGYYDQSGLVLEEGQ